MKNELIKNGKIALLLSVILILVVYFILNWNPNSKESIASKLIDENSVLATGINFDTGRSIAFDPITDEEIIPCKKTSSSTKEKIIRGKHDCKIKESEIEAPAAVLDALKNSPEIFEGFVIKDNKKIPAKFIITVQILYEGSMCHTYWSGGDQMENCITVKQRCNSYVPISRHWRINYVKGLRETCTNIDSQWPHHYIP